MKSRRPRIPQRRLVFLGCEGKSEASYAALLDRLADEAGLGLHIHPIVLQPGAGDPLQLVRRAIKLIREFERKRSKFAVKAMLLDHGDPKRCHEAAKLARDAGITHLILQVPDHEAFLLRHLPNLQQRRPPARSSLAALVKVWPDYAEGIPMLRLAERVGLPEVALAASVEPDFRLLLMTVGFAVAK